jgi:hypothetical protein
VILIVRVPSWEIEGDHRVFAVGQETSSWLTFDEDGAGRGAAHAQSIDGIARPLPSWPGAVLGGHPVRIDVGGAALYWDAPSPVEAALQVFGPISTNTQDAPDGFPETVGVVRRVRMAWRDDEAGPDGSWITGAQVTYEDVASTYIPDPPVRTPDPRSVAEMQRRAQREYRRQVPLARRLRGESFTIALHGPASLPPPPGTVERQFVGALIDLEVTGTVDVDVPR